MPIAPFFRLNFPAKAAPISHSLLLFAQSFHRHTHTKQAALPNECSVFALRDGGRPRFGRRRQGQSRRLAGRGVTSSIRRCETCWSRASLRSSLVIPAPKAKHSRHARGSAQAHEPARQGADARTGKPMPLSLVFLRPTSLACRLSSRLRPRLPAALWPNRSGVSQDWSEAQSCAKLRKAG